jgi:hypothetical protein
MCSGTRESPGQIANKLPADLYYVASKQEHPALVDTLFSV